MELAFVELHGPLFVRTSEPGKPVTGINLGVKLYEKHDKGCIEMAFVSQSNWVEVKFKGHLAIVPIANVMNMWPKSNQKAALEAPTIQNQHVTEAKPGTVRGRPPKAQVSTPHDHVFAEAPGKVRD